KNLTILELLESSQIIKCDGFCRNYCILLKISKELSRKFFEVLGHAVTTRTHENSTKLLTAEFTKKIVVFKK
ncbi:hypothetical protein, partial [Leptospira interrogans]|uniref:hypothetical protein n=1 Tax=Leptospira interrogans TaxID=173 RepID=UPI00046C84A2